MCWGKRAAEGRRCTGVRCVGSTLIGIEGDLMRHTRGRAPQRRERKGFGVEANSRWHTPTGRVVARFIESRCQKTRAWVRKSMLFCCFLLYSCLLIAVNDHFDSVSDSPAAGSAAGRDYVVRRPQFARQSDASGRKPPGRDAGLGAAAAVRRMRKRHHASCASYWVVVDLGRKVPLAWELSPTYGARRVRHMMIAAICARIFCYQADARGRKRTHPLPRTRGRLETGPLSMPLAVARARKAPARSAAARIARQHPTRHARVVAASFPPSHSTFRQPVPVSLAAVAACRTRVSALARACAWEMREMRNQNIYR